MNAPHVPLRQSAEGIVRGNGREGGGGDENEWKLQIAHRKTYFCCCELVQRKDLFLLSTEPKNLRSKGQLWRGSSLKLEKPKLLDHICCEFSVFFPPAPLGSTGIINNMNPYTSGFCKRGFLGVAIFFVLAWRIERISLWQNKSKEKNFSKFSDFSKFSKYQHVPGLSTTVRGEVWCQRQLLAR